MSTRVIGLGLVLATALAGCSTIFNTSGPDQATKAPQFPTSGFSAVASGDSAQLEDASAGSGSAITGLLNGSLFDGGQKGGGGGTGSGIGVNSYLWRATLDTVAFMPLASADPFGGVIITDWYTPSEAPNERFKVNILILGRELRADGLHATVFRQKRDTGGQWADAPVEQATGVDLENAILTRARQMRLGTTAAK